MTFAKLNPLSSSRSIIFSFVSSVSPSLLFSPPISSSSLRRIFPFPPPFPYYFPPLITNHHPALNLQVSKACKSRFPSQSTLLSHSVTPIPSYLSIPRPSPTFLPSIHSFPGAAVPEPPSPLRRPSTVPRQGNHPNTKRQQSIHFLWRGPSSPLYPYPLFFLLSLSVLCSTFVCLTFLFLELPPSPPPSPWLFSPSPTTTTIRIGDKQVPLTGSSRLYRLGICSR